jgi:hypothetical protein
MIQQEVVVLHTQYTSSMQLPSLAVLVGRHAQQAVDRKGNIQKDESTDSI